MNKQEGYDETFGHKVTTQDVRIDSVIRKDVDSVAEDYQVSVIYDEGEFSVYGSSGEVEDFLEDVESLEKKQGETNHPVASLMQEADISVASQLEPSDDKEVVTDGGRPQPGTSFGGYSKETEYSDRDPQGTMGM